MSRSHPKTICCSPEDPSASSFSTQSMARLNMGSLSQACGLLVIYMARGTTCGFLVRFSGESGKVSIRLSMKTSTFPALSAGMMTAISLAGAWEIDRSNCFGSDFVRQIGNHLQEIAPSGWVRDPPERHP